MITLTHEQAQHIEEALHRGVEDLEPFDRWKEQLDAIAILREALATIRAARTQKQAEQEPVGRWNWNEAKFEWLTKFNYYKHHMTPLYATPVRTKDLTEDEVQKLWNDTSSIVPMWAHHLHFARAVITASREKNK